MYVGLGVGMKNNKESLMVKMKFTLDYLEDTPIYVAK